MKKMLIAASLMTVFLFAGCKKKSTAEKINCKTISEKNTKCAEGFVKAAEEIANAKMKDHLAKMNPATRALAEAALKKGLDKAKAGMRKAMTGEKFISKCEKAWSSKDEKDVKIKEAVTKCFGKDDCLEYAKCVLAAVK